MPLEAQTDATIPSKTGYEPVDLIERHDWSALAPDLWVIGLLVVGLLLLAAAVLPRLLQRRALNLPMVAAGFGFLAFSLPLGLPDFDPIDYPHTMLRITEIGVIISLFGAGLKLERPFRWSTWRTTWRLLAITMPLTIAAAALVGWWIVGLGPAAALLLGAVLAPTDPVLAADVQVGPPGEGGDETKVALTGEAGLNDGLAFPFTYMAIAMALVGVNPAGWLVEWFLIDVLYRLTVGVAVGALCGWLFAKLYFSVENGGSLARRLMGTVSLPLTFLAYGATEFVSGYGFIAVFVAACVFRQSEVSHQRHRELHDFIAEVEHLMIAVLLALLGAAAADGLLIGIGWEAWVTAALLIFIIRPAAGWLALIGVPETPPKRFAIAFFGIRGIGSLYYLAYGITHAEFEHEETMLGIVVAVVLGSVVVHGLTARPVIERASDG